MSNKQEEEFSKNRYVFIYILIYIYICILQVPPHTQNVNMYSMQYTYGRAYADTKTGSQISTGPLSTVQCNRNGTLM